MREDAVVFTMLVAVFSLAPPALVVSVNPGSRLHLPERHRYNPAAATVG